MSKFFAALALAAALMMVASPAAAGTAIKLNGPLTPVAQPPGEPYAYLISSQSIDAQDGPDVVISGSIEAGPWGVVSVGLVPKDVRDALLAGTLASPLHKGVYLDIDQNSFVDASLADGSNHSGGVSSVALVDANGDGKFSFKLQLKPRLGRLGGSATAKAEGHNIANAKDPFAYGWDGSGDALSEDYSQAYLVAQLRGDSTLTPTNFTATAKQLADAVRVKKIVTRDAALNEQTTFHAGDVVNVATAYRIISTRTRRIQYELRAEVALFADTQAYSDAQSRVGGYAFTRSFMVPLKAKPGNYRAQVTLKLIRNTNEPYEQLLYTEEVSKKITVE